jgi:hypothetical protein
MEQVQKIHEVHDVRSFFEYLDSIKISPEVYGLFALCLVVWYLRKEIKAHPDTLGKKWQFFLASMISKKYFAWGVITSFFWYDHFVWQYDGLAFGEYLLFTAATFGIATYQKIKMAELGKEDQND